MDLDILSLLIFILPAYVANASPVILGGGVPMDFGKNFVDGKRILGQGKTWRGFIFGVLAGTAVGILLSLVFSWFSPLLGFLLSLGALTGDMTGSFLKRRIGTERGKPSLVLDQLTFLFVAFAFAYPLWPKFLDIYGVVFLIALTYVMHVVSNVFAHRMGWKKVPW